MDEESSAKLLHDSDIFIKVENPKLVNNVFSKKELQSIAKEINIPTKSYWTKDKLLDAITCNPIGKKTLHNLLFKRKIVKFNEKLFEDLHDINKYKECIRKIFDVLCLA